VRNRLFHGSPYRHSLSERWSLVVAVNDEQVLRSTLLRSPDIDSRCQLIVKTGFRSAAHAYNEGLSEALHDTVVFCHSDVYLPAGWLGRLRAAIAVLSVTDPNWAVLGVIGIGLDGAVRGHVYSTGLKGTVGFPVSNLVEVKSVDEMVIVLRRSTKLRFDGNLPGFHLYGTDICLEAIRRGLKAYIFPGFCLHNSNGIRFLPFAFWRSYFYLRNKWRKQLPIVTCCTKVTKFCWPVMWHFVAKTRKHFLLRATVGKRCADPDSLYKSLAPSPALHAAPAGERTE
jgi:glycosyltransferase involved in cell wall biosynthesis